MKGSISSEIQWFTGKECEEEHAGHRNRADDGPEAASNMAIPEKKKKEAHMAGTE